MKNPGKQTAAGNNDSSESSGDNCGFQIKEVQRMIESNLKYFDLPPNLVQVCDSWDQFHIDHYDDDRKQVTSDCTKLPIEDVDLFGAGLDYDAKTLLTVTCNVCRKLIKASAFTRHVETRHGHMVSRLKNRHILQRKVNHHTGNRTWNGLENSHLGAVNNHSDDSYRTASQQPVPSLPGDDYSNGSVILLNGNSHGSVGSNFNHSPLVESSSSSSSLPSPAPKTPIEVASDVVVIDSASPISNDLSTMASDVVTGVENHFATGTMSSPIEVGSSPSSPITNVISATSAPPPTVPVVTTAGGTTNFTVLKGIYCGGNLSGGNQVLPLSQVYHKSYPTAAAVAAPSPLTTTIKSLKEVLCSKSKDQLPIMTGNQVAATMEAGAAISLPDAIEAETPSMGAYPVIKSEPTNKPATVTSSPSFQSLIASGTTGNSSPVLVSPQTPAAAATNLLSRPPSPVLMPPPPSPVVPKKKLVLCKNREYDPDQHCGVPMDPTNRPCTRSLTCRAHMISMRRKVPGRSKDFDELLKEYKRARGMKERRDRKPKFPSTPVVDNTIAMPTAITAVKLKLAPLTAKENNNTPSAGNLNRSVVKPSPSTKCKYGVETPENNKENKRRSIKSVKIPVPGVIILNKWPTKQMNVKTFLKSMEYPMLQKTLVIPASRRSREKLKRFLHSKRNLIRRRQKIQEQREAKRNATLLNVSLSLRKNSSGFCVLKRYPRPAAVQSTYRNDDFPVYFTTDSNRKLKLNSVTECHNHPLLTDIELDQTADGRPAENGKEATVEEVQEKPDTVVHSNGDDNPPKPKKFAKDATLVIMAKPQCEPNKPNGNDGSDMLLKVAPATPPSKLVANSEHDGAIFTLNTQPTTNSEKNVTAPKLNLNGLNNDKLKVPLQQVASDDGGGGGGGGCVGESAATMVKQDLPVPPPSLSSSFPTKITLLPSREQHTTTSTAGQTTTMNQTKMMLNFQQQQMLLQQRNRLAAMANTNPEELRAQLQQAGQLRPGLMQQLRASYRTEKDIIENIKADLINSSYEVKRSQVHSASSIDFMSIQNVNFDTETQNVPDEVFKILEELEEDGGQARPRPSRTAVAVNVNGHPLAGPRTVSSFTLNPSSNSISTAIRNRGFDLQRINQNLLLQQQQARVTRIVGNPKADLLTTPITSADLPDKDGTEQPPTAKQRFTAILNGHDSCLTPEALKTLNSVLSNATFRPASSNNSTGVHQNNFTGNTLTFVKNAAGHYVSKSSAVATTANNSHVQTVDSLKSAGYTQIPMSPLSGSSGGQIPILLPFSTGNSNASGLQNIVILRQCGNGEPAKTRLTQSAAVAAAANMEHHVAAKPCSSAAANVNDQQQIVQQQQQQQQQTTTVAFNQLFQS